MESHDPGSTDLVQETNFVDKVIIDQAEYHLHVEISEDVANGILHFVKTIALFSLSHRKNPATSSTSNTRLFKMLDKNDLPR